MNDLSRIIDFVAKKIIKMKEKDAKALLCLYGLYLIMDNRRQDIEVIINNFVERIEEKEE